MVPLSLRRTHADAPADLPDSFRIKPKIELGYTYQESIFASVVANTNATYGYGP